MEKENHSLDAMISSLVAEKVAEAEARILDKLTGVKDETVGIEGAMQILNLAKSTIYNLKSQRQIPCFKKGKKLLFSKRELIKFMEAGRIATIEK